MRSLENLTNAAKKVGSGEARLYRIGCVAAVLSLVVFRRWLSSEFLLLRAIGVTRSGPSVPPDSAAGWFTLLQGSSGPGVRAAERLRHDDLCSRGCCLLRSLRRAQASESGVHDSRARTQLRGDCRLCRFESGIADDEA